MNKYKELIKNIGLLTISNFGSKILSFLLVPLYTAKLTTEQYGSYDFIYTTISLLIPILTLNISEDEFDDIMNINIKGTYFFTREIADYMIKNKIKGHILNISSSTSLEPAWSPYRLSKWAMNGFTKGLADRLLKNGIIVNGIAPGSTATALLNYKEGQDISSGDNKLGRMLMPEEVAELAKLMVSSYGDFIIGETVFISGGRGNLYYPTYD